MELLELLELLGLGRGAIAPIFLGAAAIIVSCVTLKVSKNRAETHTNQLEDTRKKQYAEYLRNTMSDLYDVYKTEDSLKSKNQCELFATRILDILAIITHLSHGKKVEDEVLDFITFDLQIAQSIMIWFNEKKLYEKYGVKKSEEIWSNLSKYFEIYDHEYLKNGNYLKLLPQKLTKYDELPDYVQNNE